MLSWSDVKTRFGALAPKLKASSWPALFTSLAVAAHYGSEQLPPQMAWAAPLAAVFMHFFVVLSAHRAEEVVSTLAADSSNHDLEMAFAEALRQALVAARKRLAKTWPLESPGVLEWFDLWDRRLERGTESPEDAALLFYSPDPARPRENLWLGFEEDLCRWAREQKAITPKSDLDVSKLPAFLPEELATLPEETYNELKFLVRQEHLQRAWIAWTQKFLEQIPALVADVRGIRSEDFPRVEKAIEEIPGRVQRALAAQPPPRPRDPKKYLEQIREKTRYIDIRGLKVAGGAVRRLAIKELYTPLTTVVAQPQSHERDKMDAPRHVPLQSVLNHPRLVLVGLPGGGKSTFLRRIAFAACETLLGDDPGAAAEMFPDGRQPFPILVPAAELADVSSRAGVVQYLRAAAEKEEWDLDEDFFRAKLREGCLLLIDGLDEVPGRSRRQFARFLEDLGAVYANTQIVATSRPAAYGGETAIAGFETFQIQDFDREDIEAFVRNWCRLLCGSQEEEREHRESLLSQIQAKPEIERLAVNPVMLTALASLHWNGKRLPAQRSELYDSVLAWLAEAREEQSGRPARVLLLRMQRIAAAMHCDGRGKQVEYTRHEAAECIEDEFPGKGQTERLSRAVEFLEEEETYSGILVGVGDLVRFWHQTFQEALAGSELAGDDEAREKQLFSLNKLYLPDWRETVLLMSGQLCKQGPKRIEGFLKKVLQPLSAKAPLVESAKAVGLIGVILGDLEAWNYKFDDEKYQAHLEQCLAIFDAETARTMPFELRLEAAEALGQAGDPRLRQDNWVEVKGGKFWMGAQKTNPQGRNYDPEAYDDEAPVREIEVAGFRMARYPVTVAEYEEFLNHKGYEQRQLWTAGGFGQFDAPERWNRQLAHPNWPVTGVSWYEASAYCAWVGARLPTEVEWEYAARHGRESARYPWGDERPDANRANYDEGGPSLPTPVGLYPAGAPFDGLQDMAGNVWEWTASDYRKGTKTVRGGAWSYNSKFLRVSYRYDSLPEGRNVILGFRCVRKLLSTSPGRFPTSR